MPLGNRYHNIYHHNTIYINIFRLSYNPLRQNLLKNNYICLKKNFFNKKGKNSLSHLGFRQLNQYIQGGCIYQKSRTFIFDISTFLQVVKIFWTINGMLYIQLFVVFHFCNIIFFMPLSNYNLDLAYCKCTFLNCTLTSCEIQITSSNLDLA